MTKEEFIKRSGEGIPFLTEDLRYLFCFGGKKVKHKGHMPYFKILILGSSEGEKKHPTFDTIEEAFAYRLDDGRTVGEIIESWSDVPTPVLDGPPIFHYKDKEE